MKKYKIDEQKRDLTNGPDQAIKTILFIIVIFALIIGCFVLYLRSLVNRIIEYENTRVPTGTEVYYDYSYDDEGNVVKTPHTFD